MKLQVSAFIGHHQVSTMTNSANRCVNTISATPLDNNSDTTLHVHSETPAHPQKTHGYQEVGPRDLQKTVTHVIPPPHTPANIRSSSPPPPFHAIKFYTQSFHTLSSLYPKWKRPNPPRSLTHETPPKEREDECDNILV
jgi:hypothetical protein